MVASLNKSSQQHAKWKFVISVALSFFVFVAALAIFEFSAHERRQQNEIAQVTSDLSELRSDLEFVINKNLNLSKGLVTFLSINPNLDQQAFGEFTSRLLSDDHQIRNIGAAKDMVISHVYPLHGNEAVLGFNYLESPVQKRAALNAIAQKKTILAGPLPLVQGGEALIARTAVIDSKTGETWGILSVVLNHLDIFQISGLTNHPHLDIALRGKDAMGEQGEFFFGNKDILQFHPVKLSIKLPFGEWLLYARPKTGWTQVHLNFHIWLFAAAVFVVWSFLLLHRCRSESLRYESIQSMLESEQKFRKIFHNHNAIMLLIEKSTGRIIDVNRSALSFYGYAHQELTSKTIYDVNALSQEEIASEMEKASLHRKNYFVFPHRLADGSIRFVEVHSTPIEVDDAPMLFSIVHDITERVEIEQKLKLDAKVFEHSQEGVLMTDAENKIISVNRAFTEITGYRADEVIGKYPSILRSGRHDTNFYTDMWASIQNQGFWKGEIWNRKKNGTIYPQLLSISKVENELKEITHFVAVFSDITRLKQSEAKMKQLAHYDALTGLPNRLLLMSRIEHAAERIKRHPEEKLALMFMDLDHFKIVNDSLGHAAGDELLRLVSERLQHELRGEDTVARLGGDEFAILLEGISTVNDLATVAQSIIQSTKLPFMLKTGQEAVIGTSIGIAMYPEDTDDVDKLLTCADAAMYKAKHNGRNTFAFYTHAITQEAELKMKRINELRRAIENDEFELYYQPQVDLQSLTIVGAEALIRWNHPEEGLLGPYAFINIAEETGIIHEISKWVIAKGCEQLKIWQDANRQLTLSLNVSPKDFRYDDLSEIVAKQLAHHQLNPEYLELELTENGLMETSGHVQDLLKELRDLGISLAVDDFGTGHSSISYLKHFPVNKLKIDRSFVKDLPDDESDKMITGTIVDMAKNFNLVVVAEGVETEQQQDLLRDIGCHIAQGYLYSKPITSEQFEKLLSASHFSFEL